MGDDAARWAFGQWELRRRGCDKFKDAEAMLFVREALEQATHERVAAYHASLFPPGSLVVDVTAGIGGDLRALAARGPTLGFELNCERAEAARHNAQVAGYDVEVRVEDGLVALRSLSWEYVLADPARRVAGRRTLSLEEFAPSPIELAEAMRPLRLGVMKLTPMLADAALDGLGVGVEFISFGGECREALVLAGSAARTGRHAVHVESGERLPEGPPPSTVEAPGEWLYDCDPAVVRVHATGAFGMPSLGDSQGYLTGHAEIASPWLRRYRVLYHGKADPKSTRAVLRDLGAATPEIKQRGANLDALVERKRYAQDGSRVVSLVVWPVGRSLRHAIVERR